MERIRPQSLEPFNFDDANMSGELWLAEGFTSYYGAADHERGRASPRTRDLRSDMGAAIDAVRQQPGPPVRSAVEMSQMAPFTDRGGLERPDQLRQHVHLVLHVGRGDRARTGSDAPRSERRPGDAGRLHARPLAEVRHARGTRTPGYVETPYTIDDLKTVLAAVAGDAAFAEEFFARYIQGREVVDFKPLLAKAGFLLRLRSAGRAHAGSLQTQDGQNGVRVTGDVPFRSPAYGAGLERDDVIVSLGGTRVATAAEVDRALMTRKPGDSLQIVYERRGERVTSILKLVEDPTLELVPGEEAGQPLSEAQRKFRDAWLGSAARAF